MGNRKYVDPSHWHGADMGIQAKAGHQIHPNAAMGSLSVGLHPLRVRTVMGTPGRPYPGMGSKTR